MLAGRCGRCACKLFGSCHHVLGFPGEGDAATVLSSDARTLCHDGLNDFLKKSCMEFSGSLPGDEKDEDSYSLTGEAKDATASRNGLSRNQMGIEEKAAECKEAATVLANENAL